MNWLEDDLKRRIERRGPIPFDEVMDAALYDGDAGFYATGGRAGRTGDFITSPEVGPLFGAVVARFLDECWREAGEPPVFVVVEAGAGPGTLARSVLNATPECGAALRYVLVERSSAQRAIQAARLPLEDPAVAFASVPDPDDDVPAVPPPPGPIVVSLAELPRLDGSCIVVANELLDNLPFSLAERTDAGWSEVRVGLGAEGLAEVLVPLDPAAASRLAKLAPLAQPGDRVPLGDAWADWLRDVLELAGPSGRVVVFDYATSTADLAGRPPSEWLRTYRSHHRGGPLLSDLGTQDITCEVAVDQLGVGPASDSTQADWLRAHGIDELVANGKRVWKERGHLGDLEAVRARSRVTEAEALLDPAGLGAFRVLEWGRRRTG